MGIRSEDWHPIVDMFTHTPAIPEECQWCLFLRNHDELTLEMCSGEERDYMYYAYARDPQMRRNIGIARRLAPLLENDRRKIELLNSLVFTLPGSPIIYYGDEIGMGDNVHLGDRNGVRTPMQWNADRNAGFSKADPSKLYLPVISDSIYGYQATNVEAQRPDALFPGALDETNDLHSQKASRIRTRHDRSFSGHETTRFSRTSGSIGVTRCSWSITWAALLKRWSWISEGSSGLRRSNYSARRGFHRSAKDRIC